VTSTPKSQLLFCISQMCTEKNIDLMQQRTFLPGEGFMGSNVYYFYNCWV